jgi:RNA polymerase sigma factor (sigma-70 family)
MRGTETIDQSIDIERALACLTAKQREAVTLAMQGYTQAEIAEMLGINQSSVNRRLQSAYDCIKTASKRALYYEGIDD